MKFDSDPNLGRPFPDAPEQLGNRNRLYQHRPTARRGATRRDLGFRTARQRRRDARLGRSRAHGGQDAQPVTIRQRQVEEHHIDRSRVCHGHRVAYRVGDGHVVARLLEQDAKRARNVGAVIDDQDVRSRLHRSALVADRQREVKPAALTELTFEPDPAPVELDETPRDR